MATPTIIAQLEADFSNLSNEGKAFIVALTSRVTALEGAVNTIGSAVQGPGGPLGTILADTTALVTQAITEGATVAAASTNPLSAAVAIGEAVAPVTTLLVEAFDEAKGVYEGLTGKAPAATATQQEKSGAAAGTEVRSLWDAIVDSVEGKTPPAPQT